jgi:hypothetical protein
MSIFTKPTSQIATADVQELLDDGAVENARLEFKSEVPSKDETLKKLSSFGNTFGGLMVVGAKASSSDGRVEGLPGVDVQAGYKQKLVQWCFDAVNPPLTIEVSDPISVPASNGKVCYVVHAPESDVAPHFLNGRKGIWVRTDEFSSRFEARLADENELRQLFDRRIQIIGRRASLLERARKRFDTYATRPHTDFAGNATKMGSRLELSLVPRFPSRPICEQRDLKARIMASTEYWRGVTFPRVEKSIIFQHESAVILEAARQFSIFEANIWGMLFYGTQIEGNHNGQLGIHLHEFVGSVLIFIRHATKLFQLLGYSGPVLIEMALASIRGVPWLFSDHGMWIASGPESELDDHVAFSITTTTETLRERTDGIAMDLLRYVFFSVNWPELVEPPNLEAVVRSGYTFNSWPQMEKLQV